MIYRSPQNPNSHLTVRERQGPSYPTRQLYRRGLIQGQVLDFGCGTGEDVAFLRGKGTDIRGYDPHYLPDYPVSRFDTVLCNYVLNVLLQEEQAVVLMAVSELLKPTGRAYFSVRRDIKRNGFRVHVKHLCKVYQCNVVLPYPSAFQAPHCEVYEYRHFNQRQWSAEMECPFCAPGPDREILTESAMAYAVLDRYPVSPGHALIIPKQHTSDYFELSSRSKTACWLVVDRVKWLLAQRYRPDGYNIGVNVGGAAGQTLSHAHIHVIPRYAGDVGNPTGGVRNVIPGRGDYHSAEHRRVP